MKTEILNNELLLFIEKELYNEDVLHKCFYWYGGNFTIDISIYSDTLFLVKLQPNSAATDLENTLQKIKRDLIDFKLRDIVAKETKTIRELIIAKAFAYYDFDNDPETQVSDPVGFNPKEIQ
ncbi:MAG: His-Xaa-Ser system protein HxsD [Ginsengibacter sp.]